LLLLRKECQCENVIQQSIELEKQGVCVGEDGVFFNYTFEINLNGLMPWWGVHKKQLILNYMFIVVFTKLEAVVIDITTSSAWFPMMIFTFIFQHLHIIVSIFLPLFVLFIKHLIYMLFPVGASIHTCCNSGCHLVAHEVDDHIFCKILIT
jgi:hypothetical protein